MMIDTTQMDTAEQFRQIGLTSEAFLRCVAMSNNLRLAADAQELAVEWAAMNGLISGLKISKAITEQQYDSLQALALKLARVTEAQHAAQKAAVTIH